MKCALVFLAVIALSSAGYLPHYGGHGYGHGHVEHYAPVIHKVPIATSYHHEHRTYHPVVPVVKHVPVVHKVAVPVAVPIVHHAPHYAHHGYGHDFGYGHGFGGGFGGHY